LARLVADPRVVEVRALSRRALPPEARHPKVRPTRADIRTARARRGLEGVDLLYHLAFQLWHSPDMTSVNRQGTDNVLAARPGAVVLSSSVAVYGAWADNSVPLHEGLPARPNRECPYAADNLAAERACFESGLPAVAVRLGAVLGPHADRRTHAGLRLLRLGLPVVRGGRTALQFLDEGDAVAALHQSGQALVGGAPGVDGEVLNAATSDWLSSQQVAALARSRVIEVPRPVLLGGARVAERLGLAPFGADRAVLTGGPLAVAVEKIGQRVGWRPTRTSAAVLSAALVAATGAGGPPTRPMSMIGRGRHGTLGHGTDL
jgi:nucleoside-diphosphate-sugar epimerase